VKRDKIREDLRKYETTDNEGNTEEKVIRKGKQYYSGKGQDQENLRSG
jgi:hypothetical protein